MSARWPFPIGPQQVDDARLDAAVLGLEVELLLRVERRQVVEQDLSLAASGLSKFTASTRSSAK